MAFPDFTLQTVHSDLGLTIHRATVFSNLPKTAIPDWLCLLLARGQELALVSEKSRSEYVVAPILLSMRELTWGRISITSGERLDVDADRRLVGECDFILTLSEPLPLLSAPLVIIVEAKRHDIEAGLGPCIAEMVAAQIFNERQGHKGVVFGCVTSGEAWQFLRLDGKTVLIDPKRFYISELGSILAGFLAMIAEAGMSQPLVLTSAPAQGPQRPPRPKAF